MRPNWDVSDGEPFDGAHSERAPRRGRLSFVRDHAWFVVAIGAVVVSALLVLWPLFRSPFVADDVPNSQRTAYLAAFDQSRTEYIVESVRGWMQAQGRFFPVSAIENVVLFDAIHDRALYKIVQFLAVLVVVALAGLLAGVLSRDRWIGVVAAAMVIPTFQFRHWYDPILSFGVLLPSVTAKVLVVWALVALSLRCRTFACSVVALVGASLVWTAALLQYEVVYLLSPLVLLVAWAHPLKSIRMRAVASSAVILPAVLLGIFVMSLRQGKAPSPTYAIRLDSAQVLPTLLHQVVGAVPMSVSTFEGAGAPGIVASLTRSVGWGSMAWVLTVVVVAIAYQRVANVDRRGVLALFGLGVGLFVAPALPIAVSAGRQDELTWGLAYLPVFAQGVGFGIAIGALFGLGCEVTLKVRRQGQHAKKFLVVSWSIVLAAACIFGMAAGVAVAGNQWATDQFMPLRTWQETFDASLEHGFFASLPEDAIVTSPTADGWFWSNGPYVKWRGGPRSVSFEQIVPEGSGPCTAGEGQWCDPAGRELYHLRDIAAPGGDISFILAPVVGVTADPLDPLIDVAGTRVFGPAETPPKCDRRPADEPIGGPNGWLISRCGGDVMASSDAAAWFPR